MRKRPQVDVGGEEDDFMSSSRRPHHQDKLCLHVEAPLVPNIYQLAAFGGRTREYFAHRNEYLEGEGPPPTIVSFGSGYALEEAMNRKEYDCLVKEPTHVSPQIELVRPSRTVVLSSTQQMVVDQERVRLKEIAAGGADVGCFGKTKSGYQVLLFPLLLLISELYKIISCITWSELASSRKAVV